MDWVPRPAANGTPAPDEYVFDRAEVRALFLALYSLVFCSCFFGNLLVILVNLLHQGQRRSSTTNLFLANLAVADFCVAVFCVYQNFCIYLISSWVLGDFFCKMYQFVHSLSYTASIFILVVICVERYMAIIHPFTSKQMLTATRLRVVMGAVWAVSAAYSAPRFRFMQTISNELPEGQAETICVPDRQKYDSEAFDICNLVLLYAAPLLLMAVLYARVALCLWASTTASATAPPLPLRTLAPHHAVAGCREGEAASSVEEVAPAAENGASSRPGRRRRRLLPPSILRSRRGVVRVLVLLVLSFAACHLPLHARKMWQYVSSSYRGDSPLSTLLTPITFLLSYANSGVNPLLYAFTSRRFRRRVCHLLRPPSAAPRRTNSTTYWRDGSAGSGRQ